MRLLKLPGLERQEKVFAVVANEIKELARQTAGATQDIKGQN